MHTECKECHHARETKKYQLVIMSENGCTEFGFRFYDWEGIQMAVKETRNLYEKHGISSHVGYREV